jgi:hypothetical protein
MTFPDRQQFSFNLYFLGLIVLVFSLPLSKFGMSIAQIGLVISWLVGGDFKNKFKTFFASLIALLLTSVFFLHVAGLIWTTDFAYAWKDIRIKAPLLLMPLLLSTSPGLNKKQFEVILYALIGGALLSTWISMSVYFGLIQKEINDIRDISIFISHIRLVLICCVAIFASAWLIHQNGKGKPGNYVLYHVMVICWLSAFIFFIQGLTGIVVLTVSFLLLMMILMVREKNPARRYLFAAITIVPVMFFVWSIFSVARMMNPAKDSSFQNPEKLTLSGREYVHHPERNEYENGNAVWMYICEEELRSQWNTRSEFDFDGRDKLNHELKMTLLRFMTSKGLRKDSAGVWSLSSDDVKAVENGIANEFYLNRLDPRTRIHQVAWEIQNYRHGGDPSGHSVAQRLEYWKAAVAIINKNQLLGVGTGDVPEAFKVQYEEMDSRLSERWRLRSHNQYLSFAVAFGLAGLIWFLYTLWVPFRQAVGERNYLYLFFAVAAAVSMITEDTLETQAGVTFFALFSSLFLFVCPQKSAIDGNPGNLPSR